MSNPYDEAARARTQEIIKDVLTAVTTQYPIFYMKAELEILKKKKAAESSGPDPEEARLLVYGDDEKPADTSDKKTGFLTKLGGFRKNWKKRWFVIDHQYEIKYYKSEADANAKKNAKGTFTGCGYCVAEDEEDKCLLRLESYYSNDFSKRVYQFKTATPDERDDWVRAFKSACRYAPNPMHEDPARASAYAELWLELERKEGYHWSSFYPSGTEGDMLAYHIYQRIDKEILRDVFSKITGPDMMVNKLKNTIRSTVGKTIGSAVDASWKTVSAGIDSQSDTIKGKVSDAFEPVAKVETDIKSKAEGKMTEMLSPVVETVLGPLKGLMDILLKPIILMYKGMIKLFCKDPSSGNLGIGSLLQGVDFKEIIDAALALMPDMGVIGDIVVMVVDSVTDLATRASYHYNNRDSQNLASTGSKLLFDIVREVRKLVRWFINTLVASPIGEKLGEIIDTVAGPLEELLPEPVKAFLSPSDFCKSIADNVIGGQVDVMVDACTSDTGSQLETSYQDEAGTEVKIPSDAEALAGGATVQSEGTVAEHKTERRGTIVVAEDVDSDGEEGEKE